MQKGSKTMNHNSTIRATCMENPAQRPFVSIKNDSRENRGCKCAFPSCADSVWRDSYCEYHYTHEYYACK